MIYLKLVFWKLTYLATFKSEWSLRHLKHNLYVYDVMRMNGEAK